MKTVLKILVILFVAALVAGGFYLAVENTFSTAADGRSFSAIPNADGTRPERPEGMLGRGEHGGEHSASLASGLAGIFGALIKLTIVAALVLIAEKIVRLLGKTRSASPA